MSIQAKWGPLSFVVSANKINSISDFVTSFAVKTDVNSDTSGASVVNTKGREPQPISFKVKLLRAAGIDPLSYVETLKQQVGETNQLYLNGRAFGPSKLQLQRVDISETRLNNDGEMLACDALLSFLEYSPSTSVSTTKTTTTKKTATSTPSKSTAASTTSSAYNATPAQRDANIRADTSAHWTTEKDRAINATASASDKSTKKVSASKDTSAYWSTMR